MVEILRELTLWINLVNSFILFSLAGLKMESSIPDMSDKHSITELCPQPKYLDLFYFNVVETLVFFQMVE